MRKCSKADLHVHSRHSNRPSEWILRRVGAPESYVAPAEIYRRARQAGMDFVTITDHNSLAGSLEIADLPNTFLSAEVTTYFPEDGCKVHILVHDLTEAQFERIQTARESIYELRMLLAEQRIVHTVAHPLFAVNDKLTVDHIEKMLVMFSRFEALNGTRHARANALTELVLATATPELIAALADRHGLDPAGWPDASWRRVARTGGSDDHSGLYVASAHTVTPGAETVSDFIEHLRAQRHEPGGVAGTSLKLAHSFYHIAYSYYRDRFLNGNRAQAGLIGEFLRQLGTGNAHSPAPARRRVRGFLQRVLRPWREKRLSEVERQLVSDVSELLNGGTGTSDAASGQTALDETMFRTSCRISQHLGCTFLRTALEHIRHGSLLESLQTVASLAPIGLSIAPYMAAFMAQHKDEPLLQQTEERFGLERRASPEGARKLWITDTFTEVNGVAKTIQELATVACREGRQLTVLTCLETAPQAAGMNIRNFVPVDVFSLPEYDSHRVAFPPFLEIIAYIERERFTELIISTPGPLGLVALAAARLLRLRTTGIYHTDFPEYVRVLTGDEAMRQLTWRFMCWFYGQMDTVLAPSMAYAETLAEGGLDRARIGILPRGVDATLFSPTKRNPHFWRRYGCNGAFKVLYVGRLSPEKNVDRLVAAFLDMRARGAAAELVLVGDGPQLAELRQRCQQHSDIVFTGFLEGESLAQAYASADIFVFPSTSDTFGNVVIEAQASGLPAIVADCGGPPEIVRRHDSGLVVDVDAPGALAEAMLQLYSDPALRREQAARALRHVADSSWPMLLDMLWDNRLANAASGEPGAPVQTTPRVSCSCA